jgi:hypothetical protein
MRGTLRVITPDPQPRCRSVSSIIVTNFIELSLLRYQYELPQFPLPLLAHCDNFTNTFPIATIVGSTSTVSHLYNDCLHLSLDTNVNDITQEHNTKYFCCLSRPLEKFDS